MTSISSAIRLLEQTLLYPSAGYQSFIRLKAMSAWTLTVFIGLILSGLLNRKA